MVQAAQAVILTASTEKRNPHRPQPHVFMEQYRPYDSFFLQVFTWYLQHLFQYHLFSGLDTISH